MKKETNMEHYRGEIEKAEYSFGIIDGVICNCDEVCGERGHKCDFYEEDCGAARTKWLMSEYKPEPVLTAREKHFVEFAQEGWLARDEDGELRWYSAKPKRAKTAWVDGQYSLGFRRLLDFSQTFRFITWEDESPWAVADLRKLKALEYNPEDVAFKGGEADETN